MDPVSILEQWLDPITGPLKDFRAQITDLADTHQSTLTSFNNLVNDLTNPATDDAFTGPGADAMQTSASDFFDIEQPMSDLLTETGPIEAIDASESAVDGIMAAIFTAGGEVTDTGPLVTVTEAVDVAAVVQGGADLPNDAAAAGITAIEAIALLVVLLQLAGTLLFIWITWKDALNGLVSSMNPPLPAKPAPITPSLPMASIAGDLAKQYDVPESVVEEIISKNPGLTKEQYALLVQYYKKYGNTIPFNVSAAFTGINQNGKSQIYYITQGDIKHTREHPDALQTLNDAELFSLIEKLLQREADDTQVDKRRNLIDYIYDNVKVNNKYETVIIRTSSINRGRIISVYVEYD